MTGAPRGGKLLVVVRGAGEVASGVGRRLHLAGLRVVMTELPHPLCIRRRVSYASAVEEGGITIEGVEGRRAEAASLARFPFDEALAVVVDPRGESLGILRPPGVIDARMAKRNLGTRLDDAPVVGGLGPGFTAGRDCHFVVETKRGHDLGRVLYEGCAAPNTGRPERRGGYGPERALYSRCPGAVEPLVEIGRTVPAGALLLRIAGVEHRSRIAGVVRGLLRSGTEVEEGVKVADVDPTASPRDTTTISDRSNAIAGGVLEGLFVLLRSLPPRQGGGWGGVP